MQCHHMPQTTKQSQKSEMFHGMDITDNVLHKICRSNAYTNNIHNNCIHLYKYGAGIRV